MAFRVIILILLIAVTKSPEKGGVSLSHGLRVPPSWWGRQGSRSVRQLNSLCASTVGKQREMDSGAQLALFFSFTEDLSTGDGMAHI